MNFLDRLMGTPAPSTTGPAVTVDAASTAEPAPEPAPELSVDSQVEPLPVDPTSVFDVNELARYYSERAK